MNYPERICPFCQKSFIPRRRDQVMCSKTCGNNLNNRIDSERRAAVRAARGARKCSICGIVFDPRRATQMTCSRQCRAKTPEYRAKRAEAHRKLEQRPGAALERRRVRHVKRKFGITPDQYEAKLIGQGGVCAICGQAFLSDAEAIAYIAAPHVDHDHATGKVRGLLCRECNLGLGYFKDDPMRLRAAAEYIEQHHRRDGHAEQSR